MSEIKHTPGPWEYEGVYDSSCGHPCTEDGCHDSHFSGCWVVEGPEMGDWPGEHQYQNEADARLIAAAPELLSELKRANETVEALLEHLEFCGWGDSYEREGAEQVGLPERADACLKTSAAAIAKAEGRS